MTGQGRSWTRGSRGDKKDRTGKKREGGSRQEEKNLKLAQEGEKEMEERERDGKGVFLSREARGAKPSRRKAIAAHLRLVRTQHGSLQFYSNSNSNSNNTCIFLACC